MSSYSRANDERGSSTPSKPPGILLTPGTGTTRRKRVSFGNEVPATGATNDIAQTEAGTRKRSRLTELLAKAAGKELREAPKENNTEPEDGGSSDEWEEDEDEDDSSAHDVTVDLNEPHSQSGKYWKAEFQKYHTDAKAEMEKLLKYKQLAKTLAQQKDDEVIRMAERLKDEQQKVIKMEQMIAANASNIANRQQRPVSSNEASPEPTETLAEQAAFAAQYRERVQELEEQLEDALRERQAQNDKEKRRRQEDGSPGTQKALLETQRELRRARSQVKEMGLLREQLAAVKEQLQRAKSEKYTRHEQREPPRASELRAQLREAEHECRKKDDELASMKADFEAFRKETEVHDADMKAVLERAHGKIADLKKEVKSLKAAEPSHSRPKSWHAAGEAEDKFGRREEVQGHDRRSYDPNRRRDDYQGKSTKPRSARERILDNDTLESVNPGISGSKRTNTEKPKWQPFVPRTPRDRDYLREDATNRMHNGGTATTTRQRTLEAPSLPGMSHPVPREHKSTAAHNASSGVDLLRHRFAKLGGPEMGDEPVQKDTAPAQSRSALPPERRAAAMARIEKRMAEKKRARARSMNDKENVWPA